jgi:hypothetical protein
VIGTLLLVVLFAAGRAYVINGRRYKIVAIDIFGSSPEPEIELSNPLPIAEIESGNAYTLAGSRSQWRGSGSHTTAVWGTNDKVSSIHNDCIISSVRTTDNHSNREEVPDVNRVGVHKIPLVEVVVVDDLNG